MKLIDPLTVTLCAALNGTIAVTRFLGLMQIGKAIAATLEGNSTLEKLARFELGSENMKVIPGKQTDSRYVVLKHCPFREIYANTPPWDEDAMKLVANYNRNPTEGGGGALHPLCIVHRGVRENMPDKVINLGCRSETSGAMVFSETNLEKMPLTMQEVENMLTGNACLYYIQTNKTQL